MLLNSFITVAAVTAAVAAFAVVVAVFFFHFVFEYFSSIHRRQSVV